mmetsp:Transcript_2442/g.3367  ORF Transcript_2442/g.3367 Transcript_2442/m.3367 type:complete len:125 (+) Transcript_2442:1507-1881(+)
MLHLRFGIERLQMILPEWESCTRLDDLDELGFERDRVFCCVFDYLRPDALHFLQQFEASSRDYIDRAAVRGALEVERVVFIASHQIFKTHKAAFGKHAKFKRHNWCLLVYQVIANESILGDRLG